MRRHRRKLVFTPDPNFTYENAGICAVCKKEAKEGVDVGKYFLCPSCRTKLSQLTMKLSTPS